jgi:hypothetical protein
MSRIVTRLAAVTAAAALPVLGIAAANASTAPKALTAGSVANTAGVSGYYDHSVNIRMGDIHAQMNLGQNALNLLGQANVQTGTGVLNGLKVATLKTQYLGAGVAGLDLCNPNGGVAVQLGAFYNPAVQGWEFGYAGGNTNSGNNGNSNPVCQNGMLNAYGAHNYAYLATSGNKMSPVVEPPGAQVRLEISTGKTSNPQGAFRWVDFSVYDMTTGVVDWNSGRIPFWSFMNANWNAAYAWPQFYQAGVGTQQLEPFNLFVLGGSPVPTVPFSYVHVADYAGAGQYLLGRWPTTAVATVDNNGNVLLWPSGLAGGHFTDYSLPIVTAGP